MKNLCDAIKWLLNYALSKIWNETIEPIKRIIPNQIETISIITKKPVLCIGIALWILGLAIKLFKKIKTN